MEFEATQIYEDDDFSPTQRISHTSEEEEPIQIGTLSINSNEYQIKRGTTKIGRLNSCDIVINDVTVSKVHAEIEAMKNQGSRIWICDLNSSNKTRLDDEILLPTRLYEVKDGSIIKFGRVHATYRAYRSTVIPETPAPSRQRVTNTIIPSTPDSSLNSSGENESVILGTQRDEQNSVFRRPVVPQRQSSSIGKKNISHTSFSESDDLQIATVLHASNISENQEPNNIFDMETQKLEGHEMVASNSIHDIETQMFPADASIANTKTNKQLQSKLNVQDEIASTSATNIYDMETQHYASSINEPETQKSEDNIWNVTPKKFTTDIHNAQTQNYIDGTNKDTDKNKNEKKGLDQIESNINDLETQKLDDKDIAEDISNVETQPELNGIRNTIRNICDVETQLEMDGSVNDVNDERDYTNKDITETIKNGTNNNEKDKDNMTETNNHKINYNVTHSPNSRSSSPGSLNLSSPGVDEDCLSSLQHSDHLLESSDLLEYFGEGIDKREEIRASRNTSTPKSQSKALSERDNAENVSSVSNNDEDNIFDALTQRSIHEFEERSDEINEKDVSLIRKLPKKKRESKESIDDDPEMDTEEHSKKLAKKQCKSSEISNKSCNDSVDNRNDPATSVESEDIFDALTQQSNSPAVKDTSNLSINQLSKINETDTVIDDMTPTQIINNDENTHNQGNLTNTHKLLIDINSINSAIEDGQKKHVGRKKTEESFQTIANDSLEQKLHEMFDNVNSNDIDEPPHISTQTLEDILESSQCDNDLSAKKSTVNESSPINNVSQTQSGKKSRAPCDRSRDSADTEANNVNKVEIDSQNYFSTSTTTRQKRNILKETQELIDSMQIVIPSRQDSNTTQISKVDNKKVDDNTATEFNKREKKISNSRNESEAMADTSNDDNVTETISNGNNERNLRRSMKRKDGTASERGKRVLRRDPGKVKIDDVEKDSVNESNVCAPCPSEDAERMQTSDICESDDDILTRLPAVRISGTLSNPASPSASSTSTVRSVKSKQSIVKGKNKEIVSSRNKLLREEAVEDSEKHENSNQIHDKPSISLFDNNMPSFDALKTDKMTRNLMDTSEDSDSETNYKRFKQMADRMLNNELDYLKQQNKRYVQNKKSDKKKNARSSPNLSNDLKRGTDDELKSSSQTSSRVTRHSSRQNDKSSDVSCKEACIENATYDKSTPEARSIVLGRKRTLNTIEKDVEQTNSRKRKACQVEECPVLTRARRNTMKTIIDRQSPNIIDYFTSSRSNSPVIGNTKSSRSNKTVPETALEESQKTLNLKTDENIDSEKSYTKRKINDDQAAMCVDDVTANKSSNSNKQVQGQESKTEVNLSQDKILKIVLSPIKSPIINPIEDESQEVEMIMGKSPSNVQDKNLSIRETNTAKIFQRRSRIRSRKQLNADTRTDLILTESSTSSGISDSNNTQSDDSTSTTKTRRRFTRSSAAGTQASKKKETFKKPTRVNQNSASSVFDSSMENTTSESSQNSMENDTLSSSRSSRSKVAGVRKKEKIEVNQSMRRMVNDSTSRINTSIEIASPQSTPSTRMRRSASVLNNSTLSAARHKILFTGITEDYSKIIKTLGGIKVEDPAKCSVLVTDKVRRTYKFLCALAKGVPIVAIDWLRDSESAARFLDWEGYILKDPAAEAKFGFRLRKSLDKAKEKRLLDGYTIVLTSNVAPPPIEELKDMVTSCGGKALLRPPNKWPEKAVIISREEDLPNAKKFLMKAPKTVTIQSTEFILTGILRQEADFVKYRITSDYQ